MTFATPLLLIGVLAAGIPFLLHLLSSVRAQDMMFPTLRFLRMSMEKTARRRRLQHWLLLLLRAALLAILALALAEPISRATGGWLAGQSYAAVLVLDNGYSMAAGGTRGTRLERAKADATALISGDEKPALAALLTTNGGYVSGSLSSGLDDLREGIARTRIGYGPVPLAQRFRSALRMLEEDNSPRKAIYLFSDLQRESFERLAALEDLARAKDIHVLVVDAARGEPSNVGLSDLQVTGRRVVDSVLEFTAMLANSSPTDKTLDVVFQLDGAGASRRVRKTLRPAGQEGDRATVRFHHRFTQPGAATGTIYLDHTDDLALDNVRRFSLDIGDRVRAVIVRGEGEGFAGLGPAAMLRMALDPYEDASMPWPIRPKIVQAGDLTASDLEAADIAFLCDVPGFTPAQAEAIAAFTRTGGTTVIFLGPAARPDNYNEVFVQQITAEGGLLPGRLERAVGEVGPDADSVQIGQVDIEHPIFAGLYETHADYLSVLVQRYVRFSPSARPGRTLVRLANGDPLIQAKPFGSGRAVLCTTTAGPRWSNLPVTGLFLPMVARMSLLARRELHGDGMVLAGSQVTIRPDLSGLGTAAAGGQLMVNVFPPTRGGETVPQPTDLPLAATDEGHIATFEATEELGLYRWKVIRRGGGLADGPGGEFAVNPFGPECKLDAMPAGAFRRALAAGGLERAYVAPSLDAVHAAAAAESEGRNWWDLLLAVVILVFVFEAIAANRRGAESGVPAHLQPGVGGQ